MASSSVNTYKLSSQLTGHASDVRGIAVTPDGTLLSASRDKTAKVWRKLGPSSDYSEVQTLRGHTNFVSCVMYLKPSSSYKSGLILTGGNDCIICAFDPESWALASQLSGHTNTVCGLTASNNEEETFLSASWDSTARLWRNGVSEVTFTGHQAAVWCAIDLPESRVIVTGSADKNICIWTPTGHLHKTLKGHTDCVRGLAVLSSTDFLSCANDATIRRWSVTKGECLTTYYGHSNFIYCVVAGPNGEFATSSEDGTVRIWDDAIDAANNAECLQTIDLPSQTVWTVAYLPNGDIATGSSDGVIRIFSRDASRHASEVVCEVYAQEIKANRAANEEEIGGIKISELPGKEVLLREGTRDGQTKLVREGRVVNCYQWVAATGKWESMGEVMGGSGGTQATSGKTLFNGKEYDYVFSVDVEDGKPPIKLPYNKSDDPWLAAQKFIDDNNLSQMFLDQVANFIVQNANPAPVAMEEGNSTYVDPFTGGNRYIPGTDKRQALGAQSAGASRVVPNVPQSSSYYPQKTYVLFDQANVSAIVDKLKDFNNQMSACPEYESIRGEVLEEVVKISALDPSAPTVSVKHFEALKIMLRWPLDKLHPALDVTRLAVRNASINQALCSSSADDNLVIAALRRALDISPTATAPLITFALRLSVNMFSHESGEALALNNWLFLLSSIIALVPDPVGMGNDGMQSLLRTAPVQVALSTLVLNFCVAFGGKLGQADYKEQRDKLLEVAVEVLSRLTDPEAQFRAIVAFGTLISTYSAVPLCLQNEETRTLIKKTLSVLTEGAKQTKLKECASQLERQIMW